MYNLLSKHTDGIFIIFVLMIMFFVSCDNGEIHDKIDAINEKSYDARYRSLDSTSYYADKAYSLASSQGFLSLGGYSAGRAEALNNRAFVSLARMDYDEAALLLDSASQITDNQIELLVSDVQYMRLCQRRSENKNFYSYWQRAKARLAAIETDKEELNPHWHKRLIYAKSEMAIVASTYFYYVGLDSLSRECLAAVDEDDIEKDTAQLLNYYYNIGAGGIITEKSTSGIAQTEFDYLLRVYIMSLHGDYIYWQANSLQALSEHIQESSARVRLIHDNSPAFVFLNSDNMPDSLLAGNMALRALREFKDYGDVYQIAGAYRTLGECYWYIGDNQSAIICLKEALRNKVINRAPDLVASIRERMSLVYSALNDKPKSDYNRNIYLDMQEQTRQDRQLEARAEQLADNTRILNVMIASVVVMIALVTILLFAFDRMRRRRESKFSLKSLLKPLEDWRAEREREFRSIDDDIEMLREQNTAALNELSINRQRGIEQRAKISLANSILPLIDRMVLTSKYITERLAKGNSDEKEIGESRKYIIELSAEIDRMNAVLTSWIEMKRGMIDLHIVSFALADVFEIIKKGQLSFARRGIALDVKATEAVVKGDKALTLFMVNTLVDNARKFTKDGGAISVYSVETDSYVEINVEDNGAGMDEEQVASLFSATRSLNSSSANNGSGHGYGFGLLNCQGIINKYRKLSHIFNVCRIDVESKKDVGTKISFRLPKGVIRLVMALLVSLASLNVSAKHNASQQNLKIKAEYFADKAYESNVDGKYADALAYADSCLMVARSVANVDSVIILSAHNERAVAALALHKWDVYNHSNSIYTKLFRRMSADRNLESYVRAMQRQKTNKNVSIVILLLLLLALVPAYYILYYRKVLLYRSCIDRIMSINEVLSESIAPEVKLRKIDTIWKGGKYREGEEYEKLNTVVRQIEDALNEDIRRNEQIAMNRELASDELSRIKYDSDRLYVANSILDNCFSSLKHETMYYPSRILNLCESEDKNAENIGEINDLIGYYKDLYSVLLSQANDAVKGNMIGDISIRYMFTLLERHCDDLYLYRKGKWQYFDFDEVSADYVHNADKYVHLRILLGGLKLDDGQLADLFNPFTIHKDFYVCRQIIRELGEKTNSRASGIEAEECVEGVLIDSASDNIINGTIIKIDIPANNRIWKTLK